MLSLKNIWPRLKRAARETAARIKSSLPPAGALILSGIFAAMALVLSLTLGPQKAEEEDQPSPMIEFVESEDEGAQGYVEHGDTGIVEFIDPVATGSIIRFVEDASSDTPHSVVDFVTDIATFVRIRESASLVDFVPEDYSYMRAVSQNSAILSSMDILSCSYRSTGKTLIMGPTGVTLEQMVAYYLDKAGSYPDFYADTDAPTIEDFCKIYIEEGVTEGVRYDVAFCQAMKETGFLRYGGSVSRSQFNFAGMGASGNGAHGISYSSVHAGIRAHIQHLKAFASTADMVNEPVDDRWSRVRRGSAVYVEYLGIGENPKHTGWATAERYGYSLMDDYVAVLASY